MHTETNILVATPCFGGLIQWRCAAALMALDRLLNEQAVLHSFNFIAHESLIPRARNWFANLCLFATDSNGKKYSHLMFIDADISFDSKDVIAMLQVDKPIVVLPYAGKGIDWSNVVKAVKKGATADQLPHFIGNPVIGFEDRPFTVNEPTSVQAAGTGAMLIKTEVFERLAEAHPEWKYTPGPPEARYRASHSPSDNHSEAFDFFQIGVDPKTRIYLSEDYFFVQAARELGFETILLPWAQTGHSGTFEFRMNISAIAALDAAKAQIA